MKAQITFNVLVDIAISVSFVLFIISVAHLASSISGSINSSTGMVLSNDSVALNESIYPYSVFRIIIR